MRYPVYATLGGLSIGIFMACASTSEKASIGTDCTTGFCDPNTPGFTAPPDAGHDASVGVDRPMCATSACSSPFITCPGSKFPCDVDTSTDRENCGACGNVCPNGDDVAAVFGGRFFCTGGACRIACEPGLSDCNGDLADGCENDTLCDENNCGGCGNKCAPGEYCHEGMCGCPGGTKECTDECKIATANGGGACKNIDVDDKNCGDCGVECANAGPYGPEALHLKCGCRAGACNRRKCEHTLAGEWADCNSAVSPVDCIILEGEDGCETNLKADPNNCGGCGRQCGLGQVCIDGECLCEPPLTLCNFNCVDLANDPLNCGGCRHICAGLSTIEAPLHGIPLCESGKCDFACDPRYADCDSDRSNGCETPIDSDPNNCGRCGTRCDSSVGQPCMRGRCAVSECPPGKEPVQ